MSDKKKASTLAGLAVAGLIVAGGATAAISANADTSNTTNGSGYGAPAGYGSHDGQRGGGTHTAVTGAEKTKVVDAVKAKDSAVTVTDVRKDADGSYDVHGTKAGKQVMVEVSKDLKTIEVRTFDGSRGPGGRGGHGHGTEVTGTELTKVKTAVTAKFAGATVEHAMKDADGSYHVMATKGGNRVMYTVSKDLKTVAVDTRGPRDGKGPQGTAPSSAPSTPA